MRKNRTIKKLGNWEGEVVSHPHLHLNFICCQNELEVKISLMLLINCKRPQRHQTVRLVPLEHLTVA